MRIKYSYQIHLHNMSDKYQEKDYTPKLLPLLFMYINKTYEKEKIGQSFYSIKSHNCTNSQNNIVQQSQIYDAMLKK